MSKYHNKITYVDGIKFDSQKEASYYCYLRQMEKDGKIRDLRLQVEYELLPKITGEKVRQLKTKTKVVPFTKQAAVVYRADFVYVDCATGLEEVIDVKGRKTKEYILKKKMMLALLGIEIIEV